MTLKGIKISIRNRIEYWIPQERKGDVEKLIKLNEMRGFKLKKKERLMDGSIKLTFEEVIE